MRAFAFRGLLVIIVAAAAVCVYQLLAIRDNYVHADEIDNLLAPYAPPIETANRKPWEEPHLNNQSAPNPFVVSLKRDFNEDVTAWIRVPNSRIDYPVVHGADNSYYLNHDIQKQKAVGGSLFVDSRNSKGFADFNTIIYGHNMKDGSMFSDLRNFSDFGYFSNNALASLYLSETTYDLEIFAYIEIKESDSVIYSRVSAADPEEFIEYVRSKASRYRDISLAENDKIVTLSTCTNDLADARIVVLARLKPVV
ncbi:MAG: class B sortase [Clostridiales bacterium]|jgi:sortase B|nr:class B sortase [Clostridiales bacterium]